MGDIKCILYADLVHTCILHCNEDNQHNYNYNYTNSYIPTVIPTCIVTRYTGQVFLSTVYIYSDMVFLSTVYSIPSIGYI